MRERPALALAAATAAVAWCMVTGIAAASAATAPAAAVRLAAVAAVDSGGTWGTATLVPGTVALNKGGLANVNSVSCTAPGDCAAAGSYADGSHDNQAFVADEQAGKWRTAREVPGTAALNKFSANALSVSCKSAGNCAVGGFYEQAGQDSEAFVASEAHGLWHPAAPVRGTVGAGAAVSSVSCAAAGDCVAGGYFTDRAGREQAFVADETAGTWGPAITVAAGLNVAGNAYVTSVSCASAGNCAAGGFYSTGPGQTEAFIVDERHGAWSAAHEVAGALNAGLFGSVTSVSCASPGNCAAGGSYTDGAGHAQAFVATEKSGAWAAARQVAGALNDGGNATANTVSCPSAGECAAGGSYTSTARGQQAFVVSERRGAWSAARQVAGALNISGDTSVDAISCPSAGNCAAGGEYGVGNPFYEAFVVTERGGAWLPAAEIAGNLNTDAGGVVESVSCTSVGDCTAGGAVTAAAGGEAFVVTGSITQPTSTALSLSSARVTYGHEQSERLSVTVRARYSGTPGGTVDVKAGSATICVIHLIAGQGRCALTATKLRAGTYRLTAAYAGSAGYLGSTAAPKTLTVRR
jgi:Bacterial Ig-like domain (group 3)